MWPSGNEPENRSERKKMIKQLYNFIAGLFYDDVNEPCIGRFSLFLGLCLTAYTATAHIDVVGDVTWGEGIVRCAPGLIGLLAYCFSRLMECKEFIAETALKLKKKGKE